MEQNFSSASKFELMDLGELLDECIWVLADCQQVINAHRCALVVAAFVSHPDIRLGLGHEESHGPWCVCHTLKPLWSARLESILLLLAL